MNWWGMGPFLFIFAFAGFVYRFITDRKPLPFIFFWILAFNTFYTGHLYSPRYFIPYYPPVSWLAAFSIIAFYSWLVRLVNFNRIARLAFILIFIFAAITTMTLGIVSNGDKGMRIAWGQSTSLGSSHGKYPLGAVWSFMQDFRQGLNLQYRWVEEGASRAAKEVFFPKAPPFYAAGSPIYVGKQSQIFLNYTLLCNGWLFNSSQGRFETFRRLYMEGNPLSAPLQMQTVYASDEPAPEIGFLSNPLLLRVYIGRDAMPTLVTQQSASGAPVINDLVGWHVQWALNGLDILEAWQYAGLADGSLACEKELYRFFHTSALPHQHVLISSSSTPESEITGVVKEHDGRLAAGPEGVRLENLSRLTWSCVPESHQWMAVAVNRVGLLPGYSVSVNGVEIKDGVWLAKNLQGYGQSMWDIYLIPPKYVEGAAVKIDIVGTVRGSVLGIIWMQRNYPDSQYRNEVARPLGLEFSDIKVLK